MRGRDCARWMMAFGFAVGTVACSRELSKSKAKEVLEKRYLEKPTLYCGLKSALYEEKPGVFSPGLNDEKCVSQLQAVGALISVGCIEDRPGGGCMTYGFKPGAKGLVEHGRDLWAECGTRTFGDVTSITTEGKKAKVKFTEHFKSDDTRSKLSACILEPLKDGTNEAAAVFVQDDAGNWTRQ